MNLTDCLVEPGFGLLDESVEFWGYSEPFCGGRCNGFGDDGRVSKIGREVVKPGAHLLALLVGADYEVTLLFEDCRHHHTMK